VTAARRILHVDGSQGASGDMILGALVDLGASVDGVRAALRSLAVRGWTLTAREIERCALRATKVDVEIPAHGHGRGWAELREIVEGSSLSPRVRERSLAVFRRLIEAEARVHGRSPEEVHLHEAGGTDAIVDVVGACVALDLLRVDRIVVSTLTTGFGEIRCAHGTYPIPAPATAALLQGVPATAGEIGFERLTPTGAAILVTLADAWGSMPPMRPLAVGYGAGTHDAGSTPNMLRMTLGEELAAAPRGEVAVLECTVDDATPQLLAYAAARLLEDGALDVFTTGVTMKKGRLGHHVTVIAHPGDADRLAHVVLTETTTLGVRVRREARYELSRSTRRVDTRFGAVDVKVAELDGSPLRAVPEYDTCAALAREHGVALHEVQQAALEAVREAPGGASDVTREGDEREGQRTIDIERFFETDLRVARIITAERIPGADKLLKLRVDLGGEERQLVAGIARSYQPEALVGQRIVVVANLQPARIRGVESQGMLLAADLDGRPILATFNEDVPPGTRVR
jgi:uncharacterized protein (TIGR00299 family) protein